MLPVTMDTCLHWNCLKCYILILMIITFPVELDYVSGKANFGGVTMRCHFALFSQESRLLPGSIVTSTDGHIESKTPRWCRPSR